MLMKLQLRHCQFKRTKIITACPDCMYLPVQNKLLTNYGLLTLLLTVVSLFSNNVRCTCSGTYIYLVDSWQDHCGLDFLVVQNL